MASSKSFLDYKNTQRKKEKKDEKIIGKYFSSVESERPNPATISTTKSQTEEQSGSSAKSFLDWKVNERKNEVKQNGYERNGVYAFKPSPYTDATDSRAALMDLASQKVAFDRREAARRHQTNGGTMRNAQPTIPEQMLPGSPYIGTENSLGRYGKGNIDLYNRPQYRNPDGSVSTVRSISIGTDDGEVLIPTVGRDANGRPRLMSDDEAIDEYFRTGNNLGTFKTIEEADDYADRLHKQQEAYYTGKGRELPSLEQMANPMRYAETRRQTAGGNSTVESSTVDRMLQAAKQSEARAAEQKEQTYQRNAVNAFGNPNARAGGNWHTTPTGAWGAQDQNGRLVSPQSQRYEQDYRDTDPMRRLAAERVSAQDAENPLNTRGNTKPYSVMTDDEKSVYNYLYSTYGPSRAEEYHNGLMDEINRRIGQENYEANTKDLNTAQKALRSYQQGFSSGIEGILNAPAALMGAENRRARSAAEYENSALRSDQGNNTAQKILYDIASSTGNMTPGMMASALGAPAAVGSALFATSAGGNAYAEAMNAGEDVSTSRAYAVQQFADEEATNWLLGGINAFGGGAVRKVMQNSAAGRTLDAAVNRLVKTESGRRMLHMMMDYVGDMAGEAQQEYVQFYTENFTKAILGMKDEDGNPVDFNFNPADPDALYAALLGALNAGALNAAPAAARVIHGSGTDVQNAGGLAEDLRSTTREDYTSDAAYESAMRLEAVAREIGDRQASGRSPSAMDRIAFNEAMSEFIEASTEAEAESKEENPRTGFVDESGLTLQEITQGARQLREAENRTDAPGAESSEAEPSRMSIPAEMKEQAAYDLLETRRPERIQWTDGTGTFVMQREADEGYSVTNQMGETSGLTEEQAAQMLPADTELTITWGERDEAQQAAPTTEQAAPTTAPTEEAVSRVEAEQAVDEDTNSRLMEIALDREAEKERQLNAIFEAALNADPGVREIMDRATMWSEEDRQAAFNLGMEERRWNQQQAILNENRVQEGNNGGQGAVLSGRGSGRDVSLGSGEQAQGIRGDAGVSAPAPGGVSSQGAGVARQSQEIGRIQSEVKGDVRRANAEKTAEQVRNSLLKAADADAKGLRIGAATDARDILPVAREGQQVFPVDRKTATPSMRRGVAIAKKAGAKGVKVFLSDGPIITRSGARARAWCDTKTGEIALQANSERATTDQLAMHESVELGISDGRINVADALETLRISLDNSIGEGTEAIDTLAFKYAKSEKKSGDITEKELAHAKKEMLCDAAGGINQFDGRPGFEYEATLMDVVSEIVQPYMNEKLDWAFDVDESVDNSTAPTDHTDYGESLRQYSEDNNSHLFEFSVEQFAAANDYKLVYTGPKTYKIIDNKTGKEVQVADIAKEHVENTPLGMLLRIAQNETMLSEEAADSQRQFVADLMKMCIQYGPDAARVWEVAGTQTFSAFKSNSDPQYGSTGDMGTICSKTQAIVNVMSDVMVRLERGLARDEVLKVYNAVANSGRKTKLSVPCPVCYVFSRWVGVPSLLETMRRGQERFGPNITEERLNKYVRGMERRFTPTDEEQRKEDPYGKKAINKRKQSVQNKIANLQDKIDSRRQEIYRSVKGLEAALEATRNDKQIGQIAREQKALEKEFLDLELYNWVTQVRCLTDSKRNPVRDSNGNVKLDPNYEKTGHVDLKVLFDLNRTGEFAENYPKAWLYRTTRGAGMGKAILPYSGFEIGDALRGAGLTGPTRYKRSNSPLFKMDQKAVTKLVRNAIKRMKAQNLIGGQRLQSTSDFRAEWGLDYVMTLMELQTIGAKVQLYTKVIEAVDFLASSGAEINLSLMGKGDGYHYDANGNPVLGLEDFSSITGIDARAAFEKSAQYNNVQPILVGLNDTHIKLALADSRITFIIPWHSSGSNEATLGKLMKSVGENLKNGRDYENVQEDKVIKYDDEAVNEEKKAMRDLRKAIVTGNLKKNLTEAQQELLNKNEWLSDLYNRFYVDKSAEEYGVKLSASQAQKIFPYEYWDKSLTIKDAKQNGIRFQEYCESLGLKPRFSGGKGKNGETFGDFTKEDGYWKLLIDRKMYNNDGTYHEVQAIDVSKMKVGDIPMTVNSNVYRNDSLLKQATMDSLRALEETPNDLTMDESIFSDEGYENSSELDLLEENLIKQKSEKTGIEYSSELDLDGGYAPTLADNDEAKAKRPVRRYVERAQALKYEGLDVNEDTEHALEVIDENGEVVDVFKAPKDPYAVLEVTRAQTDQVKAWEKTDDAVETMTNALKQEAGKSVTVDVGRAAKEMAASLRTNYGSRTKASDLAASIQNLYTMLDGMNARNTERVAAAATNIGKAVLEGTMVKDNTLSKQYPNLKRELRDPHLYLNETLKGDMASAYDNMTNFRRAVGKRLTFAKAGEGSFRSVDSFYGELSEKYPELFPADITNPSDQLLMMIEVSNNLDGERVSNLELNGYGGDLDKTAFMIGQEIIGGYYASISNSNFNRELKKAKADLQKQYGEQLAVATARVDQLQKELLAEKMKGGSQRERERTEYWRQGYELVRDNLAKVHAEYAEKARKLKEKKRGTEARQELLKRARKLASMKRTGDPRFRAEVDALIGDLDLVAPGIRKDTLEKLQDLRRQVDAQSKLDPEYYAKFEAPKYAELLDRVRDGKKRLKDMDISEIIRLTEAVVALEHSKATYDREIKKERGKLLLNYARTAIDQQKKVKGINYKNEFGSMLGKYRLNMLNPTRAFQLIDGYQKGGVFTYFANELNAGQTKAAEFRMEVERMFQKIDNNPKLVNDFAKPTIEIQTMEGKVKISKGMRIALYLHAQNRENIMHIAYGGITIPDAALYAKGKYAEAYNAGKTVHFAPWMNGSNANNDSRTAKAIAEITKHMTPEEREYAEIAQTFFNETTKKAINETSLLLDGYEKATVEHYFPIKTDKRFLQPSLDDLKKDGTIEGVEMLKERTGSRLPILLEDASQVVLRQKNNTAMYYGLAIPVRNFTRFYGQTVDTKAGESVQSAISNVWNKPGMTYIENVISDLQFGRQTQRTILDSMKGLYAGTTLNLNLGVSIKQSASYPFAASVIGWAPLAKALGQRFTAEDRAYMDSITPWGYMRRTGFSGTEMGEVARQRTGIDNNQTIQKAKTMLDFIRRVDVATTEKLFKACENYVQEKYPDLEVRGEKYGKKLAEVYNETLQRTQPSYDVMQRNEFLRSQNDLTKVLGAFKTQTFNMGGEILDAYGKWRAHSEYAKIDSSYETMAKESGKAFRTTVAATIVAQAMLVALSAVANAVLHKMKPYRDDKGEVTAESLAKKVMQDFATSFAGLTMGGSEAQAAVMAVFGAEKWYDIEYPGLSMINELVSSITDFSTAVRKSLDKDNAKAAEDRQKASVRLGKVLMQVFKLKGIPSQNLYNIANMVYLHGQDLANDELGSFTAGKGLFGLTDTSPTGKQFAKQAFYYYGKGDASKGTKAAKRASESGIKDELGGKQENAIEYMKKSNLDDKTKRMLWELAGWKANTYDKKMAK